MGLHWTSTYIRQPTQQMQIHTDSKSYVTITLQCNSNDTCGDIIDKVIPSSKI